MEATPSALMSMWAAGLAAGGSVVVLWRVVGRGYVWLTSGILVLVGVTTALVTGNAAAWVGTALAAAVSLVPIRVPVVAAAFAVSSALFVAAGALESDVVPLVTGGALLGAVTTEMMLGHWFLVDPRLPRWSLTRLALLGAAGLLIDVVYLATQGLVDGAAAEPVLGWAYAALSVMTGILLVGVILSLKEPGYTGVMAATGLSYLAVLTAFGVAVLGRIVAT